MKILLYRISTAILIVCVGMLLVSCTGKAPKAVSEDQAESILKDSYDTIEIVSHDTDWENLIDTFTFKGQVNYPYMIAETIGTIAFKYDNDSNYWQRYQDVEQKISYKEDWLLSGEWQCASPGDEYLNFYINISSYDGEVAQCSFNFEGNYFLEKVYTINREGSFTLQVVPGDWDDKGDLLPINEDAKYIRLMRYDDNPSGTSFTIIFDRNRGVLLHMLNRMGYLYWLYLDKVSP